MNFETAILSDATVLTFVCLNLKLRQYNLRIITRNDLPMLHPFGRFIPHRFNNLH